VLESNPTPKPPPEWDALELAVRRLLEAHDTLRRRADEAERRVRELEGALGDVSTGALDPLQLSERATALERENRLLLDRISNANVVVERIAQRLNFLEAER
jgi:predicted RNase H-like nuclease (RuvC/YqgF family)